MKKAMIFAVIATIVALCTISCSESTSENSSENSTEQTALKKGVVFRTAVFGRVDAHIYVITEDGENLYLQGGGEAPCGEEVKYLQSGDTITYTTKKYPNQLVGYVETIHWKK